MRLLIAGSLEGHITTAGKMAMSRGATVAHVPDVDSALTALRSGQGADLVMIDIKLNVAELILALKAERISVPVVACGIGNDASAAVRAIKAGAKEYIPLPPNADLIAAVIEAVAAEANTVVHCDPAMIRVLKLAEQIAPSEASVLITGESGTGKEVLARYVHRKSRRAALKFISVNCAAIPENLLESELFGHERGAFTGAVARRIGKFEEANGGTLLLDEISEMDSRLQAKLLRAIQEREIDRLGSSQPIKIDIRLIATSNRKLEEEVRAGRFRQDLFYRLNVVNIGIPALRERPQDIPLLAEFFARRYADLNGVAARPLTPEAIDKLKRHAWGGNVRELENAMHRAVLVATGNALGPEAIMLSYARPEDAGRTGEGAGERAASIAGLVGRTVAEVEQELIIDTLSHCLGNRTHAANILGISIRTLRNKLKLYADSGVPIPMHGDSDRASL
jgi:two-component system response regulator FlrC